MEEVVETSPHEVAVCIRGAYKHYGSRKHPNVVLRGLDMTVPQGTIYGLLGASGCGKTTLLSCIVGRRKLNAGDIWVLGGRPGTKGSGIPGPRVGYMPQETALYMEFSIEETLIYFGTLLGLDSETIKRRTEELVEFLKLPPDSTKVGKLSGGQQRRVSFAAALIHDPELLILDEPTVGVDPVLRQSIWDHLIEITKVGKKNVIITTHYIEESRQAHTVGLMREGVLLAEDSPDQLMHHYGCQNLEQVFLQLSRKQQEDDKGVLMKSSGCLKTCTSSIPPLESSETSNSKRRVYVDTWSGYRVRALLWKNMLWISRNIPIILFIFAQPVLQIMFFCLAIGQDPTGLRVAVVNHEVNGSYSCPDPDYTSGCKLEALSCRYLHYLNNSKSIIQEMYADPESAIAAVRTGSAWGAIYFTENYTDSLVQRILSYEIQPPDDFTNRSIDDFSDSTMDDILNNSEMMVWMDMSNQHISQTIQQDIVRTFQSFIEGIHTDCNWNPKLASIPMKFENPVYGTIRPIFTDFACPGTILMIVYFLAVTLTAGVILIDKTEGLMERGLVAGVLMPEILFSHVVVQFLVICGQTVLVLIFSFAVFNIPHEGPMFAVIILTLLQGMCGMCFGLLISSMCDTIMMATYLGMGSFHPLVLLSGVIWPLEGMHYILRYISYVLPLTYATESMRCMLLRGWDIRKPAVYFGFLTSLGWIIAFVVLTLLVLRFKKR
ncbi:ABC transporter G family member 23 [Anabrus simplex]|uniref:ABC transporter G family member 23 n=1 Tax=Anabrus simplex TaxID=316456 RepID=UPI0035A2F8A9